MSTFLNSIGWSSGMFTSAVITVVLAVLSIYASRHLEMVPSGLQNVLEVSIEGLHGFFEDLMGKKLCKSWFPFVGTLFIYILISNYVGLLPASGQIPGMKAPTSSINCTMAMALLVFFFMQVAGIKANHGPRYYKHWLMPFAVLAPLMIIEDLVKPLSLTVRLYGNIYGEETVTESFFNLVPIGLPVVMNLLSVLMGLVQALVFALLAGIYISEAGEPLEAQE